MADIFAAFQPVPIPSLVESGVLPSSHASGVMTAQRKQFLQLYKPKVVLPILQAHDDAEYDETASKWLYAFQCSVRDFCPNRLVHGWNVLEVSFGHEEWAFIKLTGRWPLWNFPDLVGTEILTSCTLCGTRNASVTHVLKACRGTLQLFLRSGLVDFASRPVPTPTFLMCLFHSSAGVQVETARIRYVGLVVRRVALALRE